MKSIVYLKVRCVVEHQTQEDRVLSDTSEYKIGVTLENENSATIISSQILGMANLGECHPTEHYLLSDCNSKYED